MKKLISLLLAAMLIATMLPAVLVVSAAEIPGESEYDGDTYNSFDNIFGNGSFVDYGGEAGARNYLLSHEYVVEGDLTTVAVTGWAAFDQGITAYGYRIDGGNIVYDENFYREPDQPVVDAATSMNCDHSARYDIQVSVEGLKGNHFIEFIVKVEDGTEYVMCSNSVDVAFTYRGPADPDATPTPTPEPEEQVEYVAPGLYLTFDEDEKYDAIFSGPNDIEDLGYDEEKNCNVLLVTTSGDPYISIDVSTAVMDYFDEEIDLSKYKVLAIGLKLDGNAGAQGSIYYTTDDGPAYGENQTQIITYKRTTEFQQVVANFAKVKRWQGILGQIRFDAFGSLDADESEIQLYYIAFFESKDQAVAFEKVFAEKGYDAFPVVETPTPKPTNTPTPEPTATPEAQETEAPTNAPTEAPTEEPKKSDGCGQFVAGGFAVIGLAAVVLILKKKH